MKGIILAGGSGTRLRPLTGVTNKHLLPVYNKPMIFFALQTMRTCGFKDVLIVTGREHAGHFSNVLGSGKNLKVRIAYEVQEEAGGIAQALALAEGFAKGNSVAVHLGDNIFEKPGQLARGAKGFKGKGAMIFLKTANDPQRFGVAEVKGKKVIRIEEKPMEPKSALVVTGFYIYDRKVFDVIRDLKPSARGELEITDVNNAYIKKGQLGYKIVTGDWTDAGTFESLFKASELARKKFLSLLTTN